MDCSLALNFDSFDIRKAFGDPYVLGTDGQYGVAIYGDAVYGNWSGNARPETMGIYQARGWGNNRYLDKTDFYDFIITHTIPQQARRTKFADAVAAWQALTDEQKAWYNLIAVGKHKSGYNLFLGKFMLS